MNVFPRSLSRRALTGIVTVAVLCFLAERKAEAVTTVTSFNVGIGSTFTTPVVSATGLEFGPGTGVVAHGFVNFSLLPGIADDAALASLNGNLTAQNIVDIFNAFQVFGLGSATGSPALSSFATSGAFGLPSAFSVTGADDLTFANPTGAPFIDKNIYTIAGNGTTFGMSTEIFLFKSIGVLPGSPSTYKFEIPLPATSDVQISDQFGAVPKEGVILLGDFAKFKSDFGGNSMTMFDAFSLQAPIPEPSSALLALLGVVPFLRRRRA